MSTQTGSAPIYFGATNATTKQQHCRKRSSANHHTIESLREIERHVRKLKNKNHAWKLRIGLLQQPADQAAIQHRATELLAVIDDHGVDNPKKSVSTRR